MSGHGSSCLVATLKTVGRALQGIGVIYRLPMISPCYLGMRMGDRRLSLILNLQTLRQGDAIFGNADFLIRGYRRHTWIQASCALAI